MSSTDWLERMVNAMPKNPIGNKQTIKALKQARKVNQETIKLLRKFDQKLGVVQKKVAAQATAAQRAKRR